MRFIVKEKKFTRLGNKICFLKFLIGQCTRRGLPAPEIVFRLNLIVFPGMDERCHIRRREIRAERKTDSTVFGVSARAI